MFGHRYFGARYFGPRYWGGGATPAVEPPVSRGFGGIDYREVEKSHRIDRAREQAERRRGRRRRTCAARWSAPSAGDGDTTAPAVRRAVRKAGERLAAATANDFGIEAEVAALSADIRRLLTMERLARQEVERIIVETERIEAMLIDDDEQAIAAILIAMH